MSVRRKASVAIMIRFVSNFPHHPQDLYKSKTVLTYYSDECQTQSLGDYYANYVTDFPPYPQVLYDQTIKDCSDVPL